MILDSPQSLHSPSHVISSILSPKALSSSVSRAAWCLLPQHGCRRMTLPRARPSFPSLKVSLGWSKQDLLHIPYPHWFSQTKLKYY